MSTLRPMRRARVAATAALLLTMLGTGACSGSTRSNSALPDLGGLSIPLEVGRSSSDVRATIATTIGGRSQTLLFDTGSVGITVFASSVPDSVSSMTGTAFQEPFGDGVLLSGVVISVPVEVGNNATSGPIAIRLVQSASCESSAPDCAAKNGLDAFARSIGTDGILGAGLWTDATLSSPLTQLAWGTPTAIAVVLSGSRGTVTLDPTMGSTPVATLQMTPGSPPTSATGIAAWNNLSVPICWQIGSGAQTCTATALDAGASALSFPVDFPGGPTSDVKRLPSGQRITAAASSGATPFLELTTGKKLGTDLATVIPGQPYVDSGIQFFEEFVVVFSLSDGAVELFTN